MDCAAQDCCDYYEIERHVDPNVLCKERELRKKREGERSVGFEEGKSGGRRKRRKRNTNTDRSLLELDEQIDGVRDLQIWDQKECLKHLSFVATYPSAGGRRVTRGEVVVGDVVCVGDNENGKGRVV